MSVPNISIEQFHKAVSIARLFMDQVVREGDKVIDATMGNGHDTLYLAQKVGPKGKVYAFDIQQQAIDQTRELLKGYTVPHVHLIHDDHSRLLSHVSEKIRLFVFNLGFLPGSDKSVTTQTDTTLTAIQKALSLLEVHGVGFILIYPGHPEGMREKEALLEWASLLSIYEFNVSRTEFLNQCNHPPLLLTIEKRADAPS